MGQMIGLALHRKPASENFKRAIGTLTQEGLLNWADLIAELDGNDLLILRSPAGWKVAKGLEGINKDKKFFLSGFATVEEALLDFIAGETVRD